ncbi:hypothetical protein H6A12_02715 [Phocea massiliensis]|uniref:Uncharacterized protein n=2 Tax=Merdimmobilis hominis TaxID=2897707 RepID=A0A938X5B9_9FIRM|nr:hypothetical protein [Merdimmobilis hominis]
MLICIGAICIAAVICVSFFLVNQKPPQWEPLREMKQYKELLEEPILEIEEHMPLDSADWAVFDDEDLVKMWTDFIQSAEVKRIEKAPDRKDTVGGGPGVAAFKTQSGEYRIYFYRLNPEIDEQEECMLEIDGYFYELKDPKSLPFYETFTAGQERHGAQSPWGPRD